MSTIRANRWQSTSGVAYNNIIQVRQTVKTDSWTAAPGANNFAQVSGLSVSITPYYSNSRILVMLDIHVGSNNYQVKGLVKRNGAPIFIGDANGNRPRVTFYNNSHAGSTANDSYHCERTGGVWLDSPATIGSLLYTVDVGAYSTNTVTVNRSFTWQNTTDYDGAPSSTITVMEVAA
jgi:hypothetical protein